MDFEQGRRTEFCRPAKAGPWTGLAFRAAQAQSSAAAFHPPTRFNLAAALSHYLQHVPLPARRIRLTSPGGLSVNAWLLRAPGGWVLVDSGFTYTSDALVEALAEHGLRLQDIHAVIYTHTHEDHMGGGVVWNDELAGRHVIAAGTEPAMANYYDFYDELETWSVWMERTLPSSPMRDVIIDFRKKRPPRQWRTGGTGELSEPLWVEHNVEIEIAGWHWTCVPIPGHDPWHVAWYVREQAWLFTGDVLLGSPTPIVTPNLDALAPYIRSLDTLEQFAPPVAVTFPGHGRAFEGLLAGVNDSKANVARVAHAIQSAAADTPILNPGLIAAALLNPERPDLKRGYVWLFNVYAHLEMWVQEGKAEALANGYFRLLM
jgi:glyoxylase-like metal-dependent hydrolase (beta-lactamase superfamily II)